MAMRSDTIGGRGGLTLVVVYGDRCLTMLWGLTLMARDRCGCTPHDSDRNDVTELQHEWAVCGDPTCGVRFPAPTSLRTATPTLMCPRCGGVLRWPPFASVTTGPACPAALTGGGHEVVALLDNVRSVLNVGAMLRTADAMGVAHLHLGGITPGGDHAQIDKTALGAQHAVEWSIHPDGPAVVAQLQGQGWQIWVLEGGPGAQSLATASAHLHSLTSTVRIVMVVGHEVAGVDPAILAMADRRVAIPMRGTKDSLNVATAFGIAAYALTTSPPV